MQRKQLEERLATVFGDAWESILKDLNLVGACKKAAVILFRQGKHDPLIAEALAIVYRDGELTFDERPSGDAPILVPVRIAVVMDDEGAYQATGWKYGEGEPPSDEELVQQALEFADSLGRHVSITLVDALVHPPAPDRTTGHSTPVEETTN